MFTLAILQCAATALTATEASNQWYVRLDLDLFLFSGLIVNSDMQVSRQPGSMVWLMCLVLFVLGAWPL